MWLVRVSSFRDLGHFDASAIHESTAAASGFSMKKGGRQIAVPSWIPSVSQASLKDDKSLTIGIGSFESRTFGFIRT